MVLAVIQARMGSTRLPGKMMLPLGQRHVLEHVIQRTAAADCVDRVIVATSTQSADDLIARCADSCDTGVYRGSETDVLSRMYEAAETVEPDTVVRICGDRPLLPPTVVDGTVTAYRQHECDYASNTIERTFPWGWGCEVFTLESFRTVAREADDPYEREHVTPYYRNHPEEFDLHNVVSSAIFDVPKLHDRTDIQLALDEASDYEFIRTLYQQLSQETLFDPVSLVEHIDSPGLTDETEA